MTRPRIHLRTDAVFLLGALFLAGCSKSGRYDVSGTVTFKGKPVPVGLVVIEPDSAKGNEGPQTQGFLKDGQFKTLPGRGAVPGPVIVTVMANDGVPKPLWPQGYLLFRKYQFRQDLPEHASTLNIEVPASHTLPPSAHKLEAP